MIVRPYIRGGNMVVYSPPGRDDMQISVRVEHVDGLIGVWIEYADGARALVAPGPGREPTPAPQRTTRATEAPAVPAMPVIAPVPLPCNSPVSVAAPVPPFATPSVPVK